MRMTDKGYKTVRVGMDVIDPADKVQMTSSDETSRQMYTLTRSTGILCVVCCHAHEFHSQQ